MAKLTKGKLFLSALLLIFFIPFFPLFYGCGGSKDLTTGGTTTDLSSLTLSFTSSVVTFGTPVTVTATLRDANGVLVQGAVVTFAAPSDLVVFTPVSATALTGVGGTASVVLNAASIDSAGATSITASAPVTTGGTTSTVTSIPYGIAVGAATVTIHSLALGSSSISAYGTSSVTAVIYVNGSPATVPISVAFTSPCVGLGKATLTSPVTTILGTATSTYKDNNCASGTDTITATVTGDTENATITVAIPATNNIQFVSATPPIIGTQTVGAPTLPKSSVVKFKVVDIYNNGKAGVVVDFTRVPATALGGVTLLPASATSDANGEVTTTLTSGTVPTPIWVVAKVHVTPTILTQSNQLTITTGLPTQNFFSLSVQTYNIEGWENDGVTSTVTIIASDRLGNPIPDGTAINFITEGSQINPASCTTTNGTCTVTFTSSASRPTNGRVTILAYAIGEKSFIASSPDNIYTSGDTFYDIGDLYIDANENGIWDTGETFISMGSGTLPCLTRPSATALPPDYWNVPSKGNTCDGVWGINDVRRSAVIVLSSNEPDLSPTTVNMSSHCIRSFNLMLTDKHGNPMPAGTTVATANNQVYYTPNGSTTATKATVSILYGTPVANTPALGGTSITLLVEADCSAGTPVQYPSGTVDITTRTPKSISNAITVTVN